MIRERLKVWLPAVLRIRPSDPNDTSVPPRFRNVLVHPNSTSEVRLDVDPSALAGAAPTANVGSKRHPTFTFDHVLGEQATQTELYDATARETVDEFMKGHNVTFLAYGQTSSGKSYSMGTTGEDIDYSGTEFTPRTGLIPRTVHTIFERAEEIRQQSGPGASWECRLSFLELYNEEIIDLLSGTGVAITIREERDGRIVWAGVREAKVKSLAEVMHYLQEGSARRKTGETSMNATSSRSHAIFSLTLVQKRRSGATFSPTNPSSGRETPTRQLRRPSSTIGLPGPRSPTPSSARGGPPSSFGRATPSRPSSMQAPSPASSEYVISTSKFNMVDLAGSERLKRTAAQGDRMKEGISINSGLLALGNVISTLCDPVKARGHIPYRDSKLTRMLQDSIGGNSLTTMIACVSPIEANIGETINTIKYASRARNIRNAAKINQVEAGWDDVEHLQSTVIKLRKQLAALDLDGKVGHVGQASEESIKQSEKLIQRLAELQREHTELYDRYLAKCSENMRLSGELRNRDPADGDASSKFNEMVEPVIIEYEKVVSALNQQLDELRGELSSLNEMYEVQNLQLIEARDRQAQSEAYVSELRNRLAKITERNTSSEVYIQDLEAKLKAHAEKEDSHADVVAELKKDIAKLRENNAALNENTAELEARLSKSETSSANLAAQVEKHEREAERREAAYRELESHIALLDTTKDNKLLLKELDDRDRKIAELQRAFDEKITSDEKERSQLLEAVQMEKSIQFELRSNLAALQPPSASTRGPSSPSSVGAGENLESAINSRTPRPITKELTPPDSPRSPSSEDISNGEDIEALKEALRELSARCSDAESRVADLATQLSEAKLVHAEINDVMPPSPAPVTPSVHTEEEDSAPSEAETTLQTPKEIAVNSSPSRRRGSMPIISSNGKAKERDFRGGRGYGDSNHNSNRRTRPQSLSQELSSAQPLGSSSRASWTHTSSLLLSSPTTNAMIIGGSPTGQAQAASPTAQSSLKPSRSSQSLEAELKFVHRIVEERDEELKVREAYIRQLEETLQSKQQHVIPSRRISAININKHDNQTTKEPRTPKISVQNHNVLPTEIPLPVTPKTPAIRLADSDIPPLPMIDRSEGAAGSDDDKDGGLRPPQKGEIELGNLSPRSVKRFSALKDSLTLLESGADKEVTQSRIDELMKEMVDKEESQKKIIEQQFIQIADLQKANNKLKDDLAEQLQATPDNHEIEEIRRERDLLIAEKAQAFPMVPSESENDSSAALEKVQKVLDKLRTDRAAEIQALVDKHTEAVESLQHDHVVALEKLQTTIESNETMHRLELETLRAERDQAVDGLQRLHAEAVDAMQEENNLIAEEMEKSLAASEEQRRQLKMRADQVSFELSRIRDEHALQRSLDAKQITELNKARAQLEKVQSDLEAVNAELKATNTELTKRVNELEQKWNRKVAATAVPPPQGPPPTTPLPPIPRSPSTGMLRQTATSPNESINGHQNDYFGRQSLSSNGHAETLMDRDQIAKNNAESAAEREGLKREMSTIKRKVQDVEKQLVEEKVKVNNLTIDLREAQKTNNKLRTHIEEARNDAKRQVEACKDHLSELEARREQMDKLSQDERNHRESMQAAQAQVASLKAQLERAVETKVNKRLLKVSRDESPRRCCVVSSAEEWTKS
ncbi:hypothetical protein I316_01373 [Kwoniella heveanensis BCC8398]|uniref:Kinesin motor domain-containing protein n=1 Tax=Kwoniella heveanensis BCC8398 TaxID=1296120 RepID=A0A1B9H0K5_9TREE|nr:hypothetical protein I316_01373 [Kwoniella heveanensis BCC8398]